MAWLKVTREITIAAPIERCWAVATFPAYTSLRDPLFELVEGDGTPAGTGTTYTVRTTAAAGTTSLVIKGDVVASDAPNHYRAILTTNEKYAQPQEGRFTAQGDATLMSWTIESDVALFIKSKVKRSIDKALEVWLESVKAVAESGVTPEG